MPPLAKRIHLSTGKAPVPQESVYPLIPAAREDVSYLRFPRSVIPFFRAQRSSISGVPSLLVAMEYLECMCKSAICFKIFPPVCHLYILYYNFLCFICTSSFLFILNGKKIQAKESIVFFACINNSQIYTKTTLFALLLICRTHSYFHYLIVYKFSDLFLRFLCIMLPSPDYFSL